MEKIEYRYIDKSDWSTESYDEFLSEPDKVQFEDENTKLPCLIVRGPSGALCGYVGVSSTHPYFEKDYESLPWEGEEGIEVHGGLTFSSKCSPKEGGLGICHAVSEDEDDNVWWFGFDCAHGGDYMPKYEFSHDIYRNIGYVQREVECLAKQLAALA